MARTGGAFGWLREQVEERVGYSVLPTERRERLEESLYQFRAFREEAEDLAWEAIYGGTSDTGIPKMSEEQRRGLALRSRNALAWDSIAGAEANLLANFSFGRGVPLPRAADPRVQEIVDEAWKHPLNAERLTSFEAQRYRSNQLLTDANLFPVIFPRGGRVRIAFRDPDSVRRVLTDPEDDERPLWYLVRVPRKRKWSYDRDAEEIETVTSTEQSLRYVAHHRNAEDYLRETNSEEEERLEAPPEERLLPGRMAHFRINRVGRTEFGTPPWARTLEWMAELGRVQRAHGAMAQAASQFIAKRVLGGRTTDVTKHAQGIINTVGELAVAETADTGGRRGGIPADPASVRLENESDRMEAINLNSGASQMGQTTQILRAPIAAPTGFGQHFYGDLSNAGSLAGAASLDLPASLTVQAWQETMAGLLRFFTDQVIQEAVRAGYLGGVGKRERGGAGARGLPLQDLRLSESAELREAERRTDIDLSYTLTMPYPGRRNLPDVTSAAASAVLTFDPVGDNDPLRTAALEFLFAHGWGVEGPAALAEEVVKASAASRRKIEREAEKQAAEQAALAQQPPEGEPPPEGGAPDGDADSENGERRNSQNPEDLGESVREATERLFLREVEEPLLLNGSPPSVP